VIRTAKWDWPTLLIGCALGFVGGLTGLFLAFVLILGYW
jgi:hypothetical protein